MEKAAAKMKGNYLNMVQGYPTNSLRALTGVPVQNYNFENMNDQELWSIISQGKSNDYLMIVGTSGSDDSTYNSCGVTERHALTMMAAFTLTYNGETFELYMIRNPRVETNYKMDWSHSDERWTAATIAQVPLGVDPTTSHEKGIFIVPYDLLTTCFSSLAVGYNLGA